MVTSSNNPEHSVRTLRAQACLRAGVTGAAPRPAPSPEYTQEQRPDFQEKNKRAEHDPGEISGILPCQPLSRREPDGERVASRGLPVPSSIRHDAHRARARPSAITAGANCHPRLTSHVMTGRA
ncbi:hypothetical protein SKAU_G00107200 [Synaphobranchus kaupii]|uniref:Uncharacterized protein n=1 Tax=Synaphobranchus kaupii TaxID=118154 RepID=A0A9Q1FZZ4_SYNKA|nr:hypothetical protein SKAU_G00107200 [Synaphobranchus kaupii]